MGRFSILLVATIAIGMFALPAVISTFSGSHAFVAGENVECMKCHVDVSSELLTSQDNHTHANTGWTQKQVFDCDECHTVSGIGGSPGGGHAAQRVDCGYCHDKTAYESAGDNYAVWGHSLAEEYGMTCRSCHTSTAAASENMFIDDVFNEITLSTAAHNAFYEYAMDNQTLLGATEACVGCHTHVEIKFTEPLGNFSMTYDPDTGTFGKE